MDATTLLAELRSRGVTVIVHDGKLVVSPSVRLTDDDRGMIRQHKAALLELINHAVAAQRLFPVNRSDAAEKQPPPALTELTGTPSEALLTPEAANGELRQAIVVLDATLAASWPSPAQRNLLAVFRQQVNDYHARHDRLLFGAARWIEAHVGRWRAQHEVAMRRTAGR